MILFLPKKFDANEWFVLIAGISIMLLVLLMPKRLTWIETLMIWLLNIMLAEAADFSIGVSPLDLYDFNDWPQYEVFDVILYLFLYSPAAYLFIYIYDVWKPRAVLTAVFVAVWSLLTTAAESIAAWFHVFTYKGWLLAYSFPAYVFIYAVNLFVYRFVKTKLASRPQTGAES